MNGRVLRARLTPRAKIRSIRCRPDARNSSPSAPLYFMRKISEYMEHAKECQRLARVADTPAHRDAFLRMAMTWISLGNARQHEVTRSRRMAKLEPQLSNAGQRTEQRNDA